MDVNKAYSRTNTDGFYQMPKELFSDPKYQEISIEAKVLYCMMQDRLKLSQANNWVDDDGTPYIYFKFSEIKKLFKCANGKAVRILKELGTDEGIGLIQKKRQGLGKPDRIYFTDSRFSQKKDPDDDKNTTCTSDKDEVTVTLSPSAIIGVLETEHDQMEESPRPDTGGKGRAGYCEKRTSGGSKKKSSVSGDSKKRVPENKSSDCSEKEILALRFSEMNKTEKNKTEFNNNLSCAHTHAKQSVPKNEQLPNKKQHSGDQISPVARNRLYQCMLRENIEFSSFTGSARQIASELVELMADFMMTPDSGNVNIGGEKRPVSLVKKRIMSLSHSNMIYVLECLRKNTARIKNIYSYLLTTLYRAGMTQTAYYQAEVNADMASAYAGGN